MLSLILMTTMFLFACTPQGTRPVENRTVFDTNPTDTTPPIVAVDPPIVEEPDPVQCALISFAGDCLFGNSASFDALYVKEGPEYFFSGVAEVFANDDLTVVNLEIPLTTATERFYKGSPTDKDGNPYTYYWYKAPPQYVDILTKGSIEVVSLANNHTFDYVMEGYLETQQVLEDAGVEFFTRETPFIRDVNGIKVGILGFSFDLYTITGIKTAIERAFSDGAEVIITYFHEGIEYAYYPSELQRAAAYTAIECGAAAVIMSHPHVIQGLEEYQGAFIAWSLGNFCFSPFLYPADRDSMIVQLELVRTEEGITCTPNIIPCYYSSTSGPNDFKPVVLHGDEAQRLLDRIAGLSKKDS